MMMMAEAQFGDAPSDWGLLVSTGPGRWSRQWVEGLGARLEPRGVVVQRASSGREAIRMVEDGGISLAILDAELPRMDGLSVLRIIRSIDARLPCLLVAEKPTRHFFQEALALEAYSVLAEPVDERLVTEVVARVFRKYYDLDFPEI